MIAREVLGYAAQDVPAHAGLPATGVVVRRHTKKIARCNEQLGGRAPAGSRSDQVSVTHGLETEQVRVAYFESELWKGPLCGGDATTGTDRHPGRAAS